MSESDPAPGRTPVALHHDLSGSGPLLVAVHGLTENRRFWDRVPLDRHFRTLRVDLRGHGESARTAPYDPLTLAADLHELLVSLGEQERPLVVGHSYGGVTATAYASRYAVRGVVNVDQRLDVAPLPADVVDAVRGPGHDEFITSMFDHFYGELDPAVVAELRALRRVRQDVLLGAWAPLLDLDASALTAWMRDLMARPHPSPYLSLHGLPVDDAYSSWLRAQIPGASVEIAPVTTHYPHLAEPSWFLDRLTAFDSTTSPSAP